MFKNDKKKINFGGSVSFEGLLFCVIYGLLQWSDVMHSPVVLWCDVPMFCDM